jgi:signal transduction histidine kinase
VPRAGAFVVNASKFDLLELELDFGDGARALSAAELRDAPFALIQGNEISTLEYLKHIRDIKVTHQVVESASVERLWLLVKPQLAPPFVFIFEQDLSPAKIRLEREEKTKGLISFLEIAGQHASILIKNKISSGLEKQRHDLTQRFLEYGRHERADPRKPDYRWDGLARLFVNFLPSWGPYKFDHPPLVQILTYTKRNPKFLRLRAASRGSALASSAIRVDSTVVGAAVEKDINEYLYVNPAQDPEFKSRYASYLFEEIAQTEVVIPIRSKGSLTAFVNVEHKDETALSPYHLMMAIEASEYLTPFIVSMIDEEEDDQSREASLNYVVTKLLHRMAKTYRHKTAQRIGTVRNCISNLRIVFPTRDDRQERIIKMMQENLDIHQTLSQNFLTDLPKFVAFSRINITSMVLEAMREFPEDDDFKFGKLPNDEQLEVFASEMAREHVWNLINNALDEVRECYRKKIRARGEIVVCVERDVELGKRDSAFSYIVVSISDNGRGIPLAMREEVIRPGVSGKKNGNGFGLAAANDYMLSIEGHLEIAESAQGGADIRLYFPEYTDHYHDQLCNRLNVRIQPNYSSDLVEV